MEERRSSSFSVCPKKILDLLLLIKSSCGNDVASFPSYLYDFQYRNIRSRHRKDRFANMKYIYFETSAINYLLDNYDDEHIIFIRDCIKAITKGKICVSPISMWEIACTGNEERKENLIRTCQLLFDNFVLFPDPIQIMEHYISTGCQLVEPKEGFFEFEGEFEQAWREIAGDLERTIVINGDLRKSDKAVVKRVSKLVENLINNNFCNVENQSDEYYSLVCKTLTETYAKLPFVIGDKKNGCVSANEDLHKIALFFAYALLIAGISFGSTDVDTFWSRRNITEIKCRIHHLTARYDTIVHRGPLVCMAVMAKSQTAQGGNRGLYKDCLHTMYLPYCNALFTNDSHFLQLKEQEPNELWGRINSIDVFCKDLFERIIPMMVKKEEDV